MNRLAVAWEEQRYKVLSGSALKVIALVTMLIDHTASVLLRSMDFAVQPLISVGSRGITLYWICRLIGRLAFPIYCFLITEGYTHTHDKKRYGLNLLIFAFISEIPWNLEHSGKLLYSHQNVFFTLFLGLLAIYCYDRFKKDPKKLFLSLIALYAVSIVLRADYGSRGMAFILFLYIMREQRIVQAVVGSCFFTRSLPILAAFVPINMYNGKRGFIRGKAAKYIFYAIYPAHILLLYFLKAKFIGY